MSKEAFRVHYEQTQQSVNNTTTATTNLQVGVPGDGVTMESVVRLFFRSGVCGGSSSEASSEEYDEYEDDEECIAVVCNSHQFYDSSCEYNSQAIA